MDKGLAAQPSAAQVNIPVSRMKSRDVHERMCINSHVSTGLHASVAPA
jgi:hypothetical protein